MSSPSSRIWPDVAVSRPARRPSSVLFPLPDGPRIAANCPRGISRSMPLRISTRCVAVAMLLVRPRTSIMAREFESGCVSFLLWHWVRNILILSTCVLLAGCGGGARNADKPASPSHASQPQPPDNRPVIAAFGDSLSAGFGADPGKSYPDFLQQELDRQGLRYRVVNAGISGDTSTDGLGRVDTVIALKPAIVILEFGGNDGLRGLPVATTRANLEQMIVALRKSGAQIVL